MRHPLRRSAAAMSLGAVMLVGCIAGGGEAPTHVPPSVDPVAGRTLLEPVHVTTSETPSETPPETPTDPPATYAPVPGLNADGSLVLVRSVP